MTADARKALVASCVAVLLTGGCPRRFDPRAETLPTSPNREASDEYQQARARANVGDYHDAHERFAAFVHKYGTDPLAPSARLGQARAALALGNAVEAKELLEPLAAGALVDGTTLRARYLLGMALHKTGDFERSRTLLRPFAAESLPAEDAVELHAVVADDAAAVGDADEALREYGAYFAGARPAERLYVRDRVGELVDKLPSTEAYRLYKALPHDGVAAAYLGRRLAAERRAAGDLETARALDDETRGARERAGLEEARRAPPLAGSGAPALGCLLPLTGKGRALGERALRGALLAAEWSDAAAQRNSLEVRVRDTGSDPARATAAVAELAAEGVVAILGSPDRVEAQLAAPAAESAGVPLLELALDDARRGELVYKLIRPRAAGPTALARLAVKSGARTVAVLAPESAYGRQMAQSFAEAARAAGAKLVADLRYAEAATTFVEPVKKLQAAAPDALFVPAPAAQLALIAPQLASTGLTRMVNVKPTGKQTQLYATADGISERFLAQTAKYLQGAVLAPLFYPDLGDPRAAAFVDKYRAAYGEEPSSLDALAYDAVRAVRLALGPAPYNDGGGGRAQVASALTRLGEKGLTGDLGFTQAGERAGAPPLFVVEGDAIHALK
jgi:ABC-type branched-subunit amino acid transport system substrate-binding protein